ncbi:MAG: hypothetical protein RQ741_07365 [Wenzhouxiangellaceae bacterium]|nr:hypothetical protein [Wenzhouxiangellaceae bacterium]
MMITTPVTLFLIWLYWYSAPPKAPGWSRATDAVVLLAAPLAVVLIISIGHATIDYQGTGLNVMLVTAAYLSLVFLLGLGWLQRFAATRRDIDRIAGAQSQTGKHE